MNLNMAVAETIKDLRKQRGVSHQVYISEIEKGKKIPSLTILYNIAKFFDMSLTELVSMIEKKLN